MGIECAVVMDTGELTEGGRLETPIRQGGEATPAGESCNYAAIIGDIKRSRHLGDRREAQRTMELALEAVRLAAE